MALEEVEDLEAILNGDPFSENAGGEKQIDVARHSYYIGDDMPCARDANEVFFSEFPVKEDSVNNAPVVFTAVQTAQFIDDQMIYLRMVCKCEEAEISNDQLFEIALIRYLAYKHRLVYPQQDPKQHYVRYSEITRFATEGPDSEGSKNRTCDKGTALSGICKQHLNSDRKKITWIVSSFSDLVYMIAYVFRSRGHHFLDGFGLIYERLWGKIERSQEKFKPTWAMLATDALHAIFPQVLDQYWDLMRSKSQVSPSLILRWTVPAAGTAAVFVVKVGWDDAKTVSGVILTQHTELEAHLDELLQKCRTGRWHHSINAKYYGAPTDRLDLSRLKPLCVTVYGVYQTGAPEASLLFSPALKREAEGAPLQIDICKSASRMIRDIFVKSMRDEQRKAGKIPALGN